ncbi:MAG: cellulase [Acidobacteria bacterium]|nr:cellulase [Acidobacteriota bacterium]
MSCLNVGAQNPATTVSVDVSANRHSINSNIYGMNYADATDMKNLNLPVNRWGGNSTTRYNWQIDAHSAAADWYFETYSDGSGTASGSADLFVNTTRSANNGAEPLITIPMMDWLANLGPNRSTLAGFSIAKYGAQTAADPYNSDAGNGVCATAGTYCSAAGANVSGNNPADTGVANSPSIQQNWVTHFLNTFGSASTSTGVKYYILDNEPSLWNSTHRDVHPAPSNYAEMYNKILSYASAVRAADPNAKIAGFEEWTWWAMFASGYDQKNGMGSGSDYATHGNVYYYPWLLQQLSAYKQAHGVDLLNILTVHCYNDGPGNGDDAASQQARNRQTRMLWDPNFVDPYWEGTVGINGGITAWVPTLKNFVSQYYPGLEIGCTEYNWGDQQNLNGATTQADVLGIYGREGLDLATLWGVPKNTSVTPVIYYPTYFAHQIYRNYDGKNSSFGDVSVSATVANPDNLSAFAAQRTSDGALTVIVINKQQGNTPVAINLANYTSGNTASAWQISSATQTAIANIGNVTVSNNSISTTVPSQSITLFVIPQASSTAPAFVTAGSANPSSIGQGGTTTVNFTVTDTGGSLPNGNVQLGIYDGSGNTVTSNNWTGQTFTSNQPVPYSYTWHLASNQASGTYTIKVGVFDSNWNLLYWNNNLGNITVTSPASTFTATGSANPSSVSRGSSTTITLKLTDTGSALANANIQLQIYNASGGVVVTKNWTAQTFAWNQQRQYSYKWNVAGSQATGTYTVKAGVFDSGWNLKYWNNQVASIIIK